MMEPLKKTDKIYVAGHKGLVGGAVYRKLIELGYTQVIGRTRAELDLLDQAAVEAFIAEEKPQAIVDAAAMVGGIHANNTYRSEFIYNNLRIQNNLIWSAFQNQVPRFAYLGSSCIYPRHAPQPMPETCLLTAQLEPTNRPYALAKIAGLELVSCLRTQHNMHGYFSIMPTNMYGPGDNFHPENSHVLPALLRRFHEKATEGAPEITVWGTGKPLREFFYVDDCAEGIIHLLENVDANTFDGTELGEMGWSHINIGSGQEVSISELSSLIAETVGFEGKITFDTSKPDGTPRKLLDITLMKKLGWAPRVSLREGLQHTYRWYCDQLRQENSDLRL